MEDESRENLDKIEDAYKQEESARKKGEMLVSGRSVFQIKNIKEKRDHSNRTSVDKNF